MEFYLLQAVFSKLVFSHTQEQKSPLQNNVHAPTLSSFISIHILNTFTEGFVDISLIA